MAGMSLSPRTKTLIALLASDNDGECLNAARMLRKALKTEGLDFHDLANQRSTQARPQPCRACAERAREEDRRRSAGRGAHSDELDWLKAQAYPHFTDKEKDFLGTISIWKGELTERQAAWLERIVAKVKAYAEAEF